MNSKNAQHENGETCVNDLIHLLVGHVEFQCMSMGLARGFNFNILITQVKILCRRADGKQNVLLMNLPAVVIMSVKQFNAWSQNKQMQTAIYMYPGTSV